jgi:hypothetical protein
VFPDFGLGIRCREVRFLVDLAHGFGISVESRPFDCAPGEGYFLQLSNWGTPIFISLLAQNPHGLPGCSGYFWRSLSIDFSLMVYTIN